MRPVNLGQLLQAGGGRVKDVGDWFAGSMRKSTPSPEPRYKGLTPGQAARAMTLPRETVVKDKGTR